MEVTRTPDGNTIVEHAAPIDEITCC